MKKYTAVSLSIIGLATVMVAMLAWTTTFRQSLLEYRSPLRGVELPVSPAETPPYVNKVVVVVISGLGYLDSLNLTMPTFDQLRQIGANAAIQSYTPSYNQSAAATLISGAPPDSNDAPPVDVATSERIAEGPRLMEIDTLFSRVAAEGRQTALLGPTYWRRLLPRNQLDYTLLIDEPNLQSDALIYEAALPIIRDSRHDLVLIQFSQLATIARQGGTGQPAYQAAATQIDAYLTEIHAGLDLGSTTLIILGDHGYTEAGGSGGSEAEVIQQPLIMVGAQIIPGNYSPVWQTDLAPTMGTLLGLAPPQATQGRILFEMLEISEYDRANLQLTLARQRVALLPAYLTALGDEPTLARDTLRADLEQAQITLDNNNAAGAYQLARLIQEEVDRLMQQAHHSRVRREQLRRLPLLLLLGLVWLLLLWRNRGFHALSIIITAALTIGLYHGLYQLQGYGYTISTMTDVDSFVAEIIRRTTVSLFVGGGLLLILLMLTGEARWLTLLGTGYGFGSLVTFVFMLAFAWGYWQNGWLPTWHLPAVGPLFWQISGAFEALTAATVALVLPWPIMLFNMLVNLIRRRLTRRPAPPEADALPGLRL